MYEWNDGELVWRDPALTRAASTLRTAGVRGLGHWLVSDVDRALLMPCSPGATGG
jgi:hypothetical protein